MRTTTAQLIGAGQGGSLGPPTAGGLTGVAPADAGAAGGVTNVAHQVGGSLGLPVLIAVSRLPTRARSAVPR